MKILQIAPPWLDTPPKEYGGTEWVIANLVKGLKTLGEDVTLFATKTSKSYGNLKYAFRYPLLSQNIAWTEALPPLIHYHEAYRLAKEFDIVHAHLSSATDRVVLPLLADLTEMGIPNVLTIHSRGFFGRFSKIDKMLLNLYGNQILAVSISESMHKDLPKQFKDGGVVHNSLDIAKFRFNPKGGKYLTWLGKIIPEKGLAEAIKIAKEANEQLIFAGVVDQYVEKSVRYFNEVIKPLIDGNQIKYLGPADLNLKNKLLGEAKAFLYPLNWEEPFGMVLIESMACGTPVISYNRGAVSELIENGINGFVVRGKDAMMKALRKIAKISRIKCRQFAEAHFSPTVAAGKYLSLYNYEILSRYASVDDRLITSPIILPGFHSNTVIHAKSRLTIRSLS